MKLLNIAVNAPLDNTLTYSVPETLLSEADKLDTALLIGRRVLVPLGGRKVTGYILGEAESGETKFRIRNIHSIIDCRPVFFAGIIPLFKWIAAYYHYPIGEVIKSALPGGMTPKSIKFLKTTDRGVGGLQISPSFQNESWAIALCETGQLSPKVTKELLSDSGVKVCHPAYT